MEGLAQTMPVDSLVNEQLWYLEIVENQWHEVLEEVSKMAPKCMRIDVKIANARVRELEERLRQYEDGVLAGADAPGGSVFDQLEDVGQADLQAERVPGRASAAIDDYNDVRAIDDRSRNQDQTDERMFHDVRQRMSLRQFVRSVVEETW
jgi:hypothetical protein